MDYCIVLSTPTVTANIGFKRPQPNGATAAILNSDSRVKRQEFTSKTRSHNSGAGSLCVQQRPHFIELTVKIGADITIAKSSYLPMDHQTCP